MNTVTIYNLDDKLVEMIDRQAKADGSSRNEAIKQLLAQAVGMKPLPSGRRHADFAPFCGVWSEQESKAFDELTAQDFSRVNPADWR